MRLFSSLSMLCILVSATAASAVTEIRNATTIPMDAIPEIELLSSSEDGLSLRFALPVMGVEEISMGSERYQSVTIPGGGLTGDIGQPALPTFTRLVMIPDDAGVEIEVTVEDQEELAGYRLFPMQDEGSSELALDAAAYSRDDFGETEIARIGSPALSRNLRVVPLTFQPVRYNPARGTLRIAGRVKVDIRFEGTNPENPRRRAHASIPPGFDRLYRELIVNYELPRGVTIENGTYLLICPNSSQVTSRLQPLIDWRNRKGQPVYLATTGETGTTKENIKAFIQNAYDTWENPPEYVCLVGDANGTIAIPTWYENLSGYSGEGDHPYTQLEGNDILSDLHVGRLSVTSNTELELVVQKVVGYESTPYVAQDLPWFQRACVVGDPNQSGYSCVQVQQWIKNRLVDLGYTQVDTIYSGNFVSQMTTALNRGDTVFSYRGYWNMSGWSNSNTYALSNGWKMPFVVTITCDTGSFADDTAARSEGFLRAGAVGSPKGGIGAIGTATLGTHTRYNNCMHYGIYYGLLYTGHYNLGAALTRGKYEMYLNYNTVDYNHVVIWSHWNNLMGDPAVECWTGAPEETQVVAPASIAIGQNAVTVSVLDRHGSPVEGAQVCLRKGAETYVVGLSDAAGEVELGVNAATAGEMLLTVTQHNRQPYLGTIQVAGAAKYVAYEASSIDDDASGESVGNGDGTLNPGETIELRVQLKNYGIQNATAVEATISSDDPYVTIVDGEETFGDIAGNGSAWSADDFGVTLSADCPHGRTIRLSLDVVSGSDAWHSIIDLGAVAADLVADGYHLYNVGGNGRLDPGETGQISIILRNDGEAVGESPIATVLSMSEHFDFPKSIGSYPSVNVGGTGENTSDPFTIHVSPDCFPGYVGGIRVLLEFSGGMRDTTDLQIPIGQRASTDPTGPDRYGYVAYDNTDAAYPEAPVYNWIELDPAYGGSGATEVILGDYGDYQDKSKVVDLPFPFVYYGESFTKATICSNGWVSMGSIFNAEYRNWTIPGAGGPEAMIAPFWDDLYQQSGTSKVFTKYDAANHTWTVEWSRMKNIVGGQTETFEVILFDPAYHPTETGDGEILFQYSQISNIDGTDGYATTGIENRMQDDGVLWTFFNVYTPGSANLTANRAIRFVPTEEVLAGTIHGTVTNQSWGGAPIADATVTIAENGHQYQTEQNGSYLATEAPGVYTVIASHASFEPDTVSNVQLLPGSSEQIDFSLRDILAPTILHTARATTSDTIGPYLIRATILDYSSIAQAELHYRIDGGTFTQLNMIAEGSGSYTANIPGQPWTTTIEYYIYARDSGSNEATAPPGAPEELYRFYVAPTVALYTDDMEHDRGWTAGDPDDTATSGIWVRVDPNATYHDQTMVQPEDDHTPLDGRFCWVTGNTPPGGTEGENDVDGGWTTLTSPRLNLAVDGIVVLRYYRWFTNDTANNPGEDAWIVEVSDDDGLTWTTLEQTLQSDRSWKLMEFDLGSVIDFTDQVRVRFVAQDNLGPSVVEAAVDDFAILATGLLGADAGEPGGVASFGLEQNRPNPFNPRTTIRFSLERDGSARLTVFDIAGRAVRILADGARPAGVHSVEWDGRDDAGHPLPSGIYLYRVESGSAQRTRKMILLQ